MKSCALSISFLKRDTLIVFDGFPISVDAVSAIALDCLNSSSLLAPKLELLVVMYGLEFIICCPCLARTEFLSAFDLLYELGI